MAVYEVEELRMQRTLTKGCYSDGDAEDREELLVVAGKLVTELKVDGFYNVVVHLCGGGWVEVAASTEEPIVFGHWLNKCAIPGETLWYPSVVDVKIV